MSKTEKIVCAVTLIALGGLWFATEGNVWGLMMIGAGALMALSLKAPAKAENPLYGQDGIPKGFESKYQKWMKENTCCNHCNDPSCYDYRNPLSPLHDD